jgi:hypothetical protein
LIVLARAFDEFAGHDPYAALTRAAYRLAARSRALLDL